MIEYDSETIRENIRVFDKAHIIKQVILISADGVTRNIEFELIDEGEENEFI